MMRIREEIRGDVAVLTVSGTLMNGPDVARFFDHARSLVKDGITSVVADFSRVKWFGSTMLGVLVKSLVYLNGAGGDLRLTGITEKIESILMATKLAGIFRTFDTPDRAVASFEADAHIKVA